LRSGFPDEGLIAVFTGWDILGDMAPEQLAMKVLPTVTGKHCQEWMILIASRTRATGSSIAPSKEFISQKLCWLAGVLRE
jgi:hypothetical protein